MPDARVAFFRGLIDYAGLFPPESRDMVGAIAGYEEAQRHTEAWIVHRFLVPADRVEELRSHLGGRRWPLAVVVGSPDREDWSEAVHASLASLGGAGDVAAVEIKLPRELPAAEDLRAVVEEASPDTDIYFEVRRTGNWEHDLARSLDAIAESQRHRSVGAKLRCGGPQPADFPGAAEVAEFIAGCLARGLTFKATAGLHHPFCHIDDGLGVDRHGFVNLTAAAVLAMSHDLGVEVLTEIVAEQDASRFSLSSDALAWGDLAAGFEAIEAGRAGGLVGFGSCSFTEPVAELEAWALPAGGPQ